MKYDVVGVLGAGVMGSGVAQALAEHGHRVVLVDSSSDALKSSQRLIGKNIRLACLLNKEARPTTDAIYSRINFSTRFDALAEARFVVENVTENWFIKESVYRQLDRTCSPEVCIGVNTSAISITKLGSITNRPGQVIGMHFMNPVPVMPTVELIRGYHTSQATIEAAQTLVADMGKESILVQDSPGFVTNRVMMLMVNEAIFLVQEGVATSQEVDRLFKTCFGHKMGPLETADLIGLDTILYSIEVLSESFDDSKYRPCTLLKKMVSAGLLGQKSGEGFYRYS